ncbi:hypothetical protein GM418_15915 [Maribellus comscasis]|uniref:ATP-grasp domain-containing protein n=1 Tax=Maribellus comscasis TaxID=2681766 RepID=A0A6I6JRP5_9BACT|nr:hypothetical protein [Maribellus comscasis]QGY45101.1 hypothetical protein GM418_15915 [Maribellus comscasis]
MKYPDVYLFNPTCEYAVANGNASWHPNRILQKMESDLATLPMFYAQSTDLILVDKLPSDEFIEQLGKVDILLPQFVLRKKILNSDKSKKETFNKLSPWGWSPAAHKLLSPLKAFCSEEFNQSPASNWHPEHRKLYSKGFALQILKQLVSAVKSDLFIEEELFPEICRTREEIERLISRWGRLMVKAPWSSSGRGLQPITKTPVHEKVWEKLMGIVNDQGFTLVEPYLDKVADMALQFEVKKGKVSFLGISNFLTDQKGQYQGNLLNGLPDAYSKEIKNFITEIPEIIIEPLINILENSKLSQLYEGNFGVDTLLFRDKKEQLKINPCLEINVRQNMGFLSLYLEKLIYPGEKGIFRTYYQPGKSFYSFKTEMEKKHRLKITSKKIKSGFFALTEATNEAQFGAYILV